MICEFESNGGRRSPINCAGPRGRSLKGTASRIGIGISPRWVSRFRGRGRGRAPAQDISGGGRPVFGDPPATPFYYWKRRGRAYHRRRTTPFPDCGRKPAQIGGEEWMRGKINFFTPAEHWTSRALRPLPTVGANWRAGFHPLQSCSAAAWPGRLGNVGGCY